MEQLKSKLKPAAKSPAMRSSFHQTPDTRNQSMNQTYQTASNDRHVPLFLSIETQDDVPRTSMASYTSDRQHSTFHKRASLDQCIDTTTTVDEVSLDSVSFQRSRISPQKYAANHQRRMSQQKQSTIETTRTFFDSTKLYVKSIQDYQTGRK
jgi:hypothetical protein